MLTKLTVRNFKRFGAVGIELANPVVFIGPNNSGKTSALQALALWAVGVRRWNEKRSGKTAPEKRPGVTINRLDLVTIPVPDANLLWRDLHVRDVRMVKGKVKDEQETKNIRMDIIVEGVTEDRKWECGLEFDYANQESIYCRSLRLSEAKNQKGKIVVTNRMPIPEAAGKVLVAFLPPMSGLSANETRLDAGTINVRVGEGRTADVLRNLCYKIYSERPEDWGKLVAHIQSLFGSELKVPKYIPERGEITMGYKEDGVFFDLSSSGRGLQQTLLLLSYLYSNRGAVLLLDEPDAHLEILRQRQIYQRLVDVARENGNQVIAASHSEVLLNEAADRDLVIAFVGKPHRIDDRGSQVSKALREIGFEHYYLAQQTGWVLYLEGASDLAILRAFAEVLGYKEAVATLEKPFVHYVGNQPNEVKRHFHGLREAEPNLGGIALFDRLDQGIPRDLGAEGLTWSRREIENYLCYPEVLEAYAAAEGPLGEPGPLFAERRIRVMKESIREVEQAMEKLRKGSPWDLNTKVSDEFLTPLFEEYFKKLGLPPNVMAKKNFHELARLIPKEKMDPEIKRNLDAIVRVAKTARPSHE